MKEELRSARLGGVWFTARCAEGQIQELVRRYDMHMELLGNLELCSAELFAQCGDKERAMRYVEQARAAIDKANRP